MKKLVLVSILVLVISGAAFADHPNNKWGIGVLYVHYNAWGGGSGSQLALSLKVPSVPIFWAVNLGFGGGLDLYLSGDRYMVNGALVPSINLHYYVGLGLWGNINTAGEKAYLALGARVPIGLSWHALDFLEVFLAITPSLGLQILDTVKFPAGGWPIEVGARLWL